MKIRIPLLFYVLLLIASCQKESSIDDIRLSKVYLNGNLEREYFYDQNGLNYLIQSYFNYRGTDTTWTIDEYEYDSEGKPIHRTFINWFNNFNAEYNYYYNEETGSLDSVAKTENGVKKYVHRYYFFMGNVEIRRFEVYENQPSQEYNRIMYWKDGNNDISDFVSYQFDKEEGTLRWSDSSHYEYDIYKAPVTNKNVTGIPYSKHNKLNKTRYEIDHLTGKVDTSFQEFECSYNEDLYPTKMVNLSVGVSYEYEYINLNK